MLATSVRTSEHESGCVGKAENRSVHAVVIYAFLREARTASNLLASYPVSSIHKEHHSLHTNNSFNTLIPGRTWYPKSSVLSGQQMMNSVKCNAFVTAVVP